MTPELASCLGSFRSTFDAGKAARVVRGFISAVENDSDSPMPLYRLSRVAEFYGRWDLWTRTIALAIALEHDTPQSVYHRACAKRRLGDWSGWSDNKARHLAPWAPSFEPAFARRLRWMAHECTAIADTRDKRLLIVDEGGFGDSLQALCFVKPLAAAARRIILVTKPELEQFVVYNFDKMAEVVTTIDQVCGEVEEWVFSWSVPALFQGIPTFEALVAPDSIRRERFDTHVLQIGICWAASDYGLPPNGDRRSIQDLAVLEPLLSLPSTQWHSLQVGPGASDVYRCPPIQQPDPPVTTFTDMANLLGALDCVVTVDTATVHLAGRMAVPTFALLRCSSDDRWGFGDTTPWYPTVQLLRQPDPGDWASVVGMAAQHIRALTLHRR